jgi:hypothetical protein
MVGLKYSGDIDTQKVRDRTRETNIGVFLGDRLRNLRLIREEKSLMSDPHHSKEDVSHRDGEISGS